ncbi:MAG: GumC family protein [Veillonellales bacterium]
MEESKLDLQNMIKIVKRRRKLIVGIFAGITLCAAAVSFSMPSVYESETTFRVKQPNGLASSLVVDMPIKNPGAAVPLLTYAEILRSRTVVQDVIEKTQAVNGKTLDYNSMLNRITTQPVKDTEILRVKVTASSPEEAQFIAQTLTESFNSKLTEWSRSEQAAVRKFIGERLTQSQIELEKAEIALQDYKSANKLTDPGTETKALVDTLSTINKLAADSAVAQAAAQGKLANAQQELAGENPGFIADNPLIQQYKTKLSDLEVQLVGLTLKYTPNHPTVIATQAAIQETQKRLNDEAASVVNAEAPSMNPIHQLLLQSRITAEAEIAAASAQQGAIDRIVNQNQQELGKMPMKERGLAKVMRDATVAQEIYIMLAKRYEEARISEVMQPTDLQLIDSATRPDRPISPNKVKIIVIGALLGLFTGIGLALLTEYLNQSIRTADDVKRYFNLPVLGSIPHFDQEYRAPAASLTDKLRQITSGNMQKGV